MPGLRSIGLVMATTLAATLVTPARAAEPAAGIRVHWQADVNARVRQRVESLLAQTRTSQPIELTIGPADAGTGESEAFALQIQPRAQGLHITVHGRQRGLLYGTYAALERLGYRFWHPLKPYIPAQVTLPAAGTVQEAPDYPSRGFTHHTMHPLEMAHVLNGWGPAGPQDRAGWEQLLPEWESYLEWLIANRQNEMEWVLLEKAGWQTFARSRERQARLRRLVELGHAWQLRIGIDAPLALEQQNGWRLIPRTGQADDELRQLDANLDWLAATGVDFLSTELGTSEFTHGGSEGILRWLNAATDHLARKGLPFYSKIHISSGQTVKDFRDPQTEAPLNVNFLPYYADPRLGVMAHTVQFYGLDDPAPTYGHQDFSDMHRFMRMTSGKRPMLWYPETAYWVNFDIHVPLFLPVYARQRVHDLRLLHAEKLDLQGQILFSSGWENGYWLNDVLAGRAAWNTRADQDDAGALRAQLQDTFAPYGPAAAELVELLQDTMEAQHRLLILGQTGAKPPADVSLRNGIAYLAGQDTWSQLAGLIRSAGLSGYQTQPERLEFEALRHDPAALRLYRREIAPLLEAINVSFADLAHRADLLSAKVPAELQDWYAELRNGLTLDHLRAELVYQLMEAAADKALGLRDSARARLKDGLNLLAEAEAVETDQVAQYRADPARIAGWGAPNPTAYRYGYLWPARELFFWKRDWLQVATDNYHPCLLNIIDPLEIALPNPAADARAGLARGLLPLLGWRDCFEIQRPDLSLEHLAGLL